ncbi:MAG: hypothetical protein WC736_15505 [Gallionella sp.]
MAEVIGEIYEFSCVGGNAHIVIDDWNLNDDSIRFCLKVCEENESCYSKEQINLEKVCLTTLLSMPLDQRASALAIHNGWLEIPSE